MNGPLPVDEYGKVLSRWEAGWAKSRRLRPAQRFADRLTVSLGELGRDVEHIGLSVHRAWHARLAEMVVTTPEAWLTVPTLARASTEDLMRAHGLEVAAPEWLMRSDLTRHPTAAAPPGYALDVHVQEGVIVGEATMEGMRAADARMAVVGRVAVADKVATEPAHRRRGLATALMSALVDRAQRRGAETGLLIAAEEGRRLFERLGWTVVVPIVVAHGKAERRL